MTRPKRKSHVSKHDANMLAVLDVLLEREGYAFCDGEPGEVLRNLADAAGIEYKQCSLAVLGLEAQGLVEVSRLDEPRARRANRVVCVEAS